VARTPNQKKKKKKKKKKDNYTYGSQDFKSLHAYAKKIYLFYFPRK
jgi:hypothetical protein